jgi:hypothetical protein
MGYPTEVYDTSISCLHKERVVSIQVNIQKGLAYWIFLSLLKLPLDHSIILEK